MPHTAKAYFKPEHNAHPVLLTTAAEIDQLLDALSAESWNNSVAALYIDGHLNYGVPDHELQIAINYADKTTGALRYTSAAGTYFTKGSNTPSDSVVYYYMGNDREFPLSSLIPLAAVRTAAKQFLQSGGTRPTEVEWQQ